MMSSIQIVIIDPNEVTRAGLETLLKRDGTGIQIVSTCAEATECEARLRNLTVDVLIIDDALPLTVDLSRWIEKLRGSIPALHIIVLSFRLEVDYIQQLIERGAVGFVHKEGKLRTALLNAIDTVMSGDVYLSPRASILPYVQREQRHQFMLNNRDLAVVRLMRHGLTVQECAARLGTNDRAIYRSREKLRRALGVPTSELIVEAAVKHGLLND